MAYSIYSLIKKNENEKEKDKRPTWNETYINMCKTLSERSTCLRIQTASIIVKNNVIVSVGYNGVVLDQEHCCEFWKKAYKDSFKVQNTNIIFNEDDIPEDYNQLCQKIYQSLTPIVNFYNKPHKPQKPQKTYNEFIESKLFYIEHHRWSNENELHGEMNAILFAGKNGISLEGSNIYTIYSPCIHCAKSIYTSGIKKVYYKEVYKRDTLGIDFLSKNGIEVEKLK